MANVIQKCLHTPPNIPSCFDRFVTGHWWWKWKRCRAEVSLAKALDESASNPINLRRADIEFEKTDFADIYGRPSSPRIRAVVKAARKAEVSLIDLWILVINNDIQEDNEGKIFVKRIRWMFPLIWGMRISVLLQIFRFSFLFFSSSAPLWVKMLSEVFSLFFFGACLFYFEIFTARSEQAVKRTGNQIEETAARLSSKKNIIELNRP